MPRNPTGPKFRGRTIVPLIVVPTIVLHDLFESLHINGADAWLATAATLPLLCAAVHLTASALAHRADHPPERELELQVADLCRRDGLLAVQVDPEANVKAYLPNGSLVLIRCAPTTEAARPTDLHHFIGTAHHDHQADVPVFVAQPGFTTEARHFAEYHGIALIDRARLTQWQQGEGLAALVATTP